MMTSKKKSLSLSTNAPVDPGEHKHSIYLINFYYLCKKLRDMKFKSMGGLTVKDGRLINDNVIGETGIAQMAQMRKQAKNASKVDIIADGIELAEGRKGFYRE
jgi:hypothetical protein